MTLELRKITEDENARSEMLEGYKRLIERLGGVGASKKWQS